jgi:hypothetical protein
MQHTILSMQYILIYRNQEQFFIMVITTDYCNELFLDATNT